LPPQPAEWKGAATTALGGRVARGLRRCGGTSTLAGCWQDHAVSKSLCAGLRRHHLRLDNEIVMRQALVRCAYIWPVAFSPKQVIDGFLRNKFADKDPTLDLPGDVEGTLSLSGQ
jgi:hypothetical protein